MAIKKDITVTVQGQKSIMSDDNIYIYQGDKDIDLYFTIIDNRFEFEATTVKKYNFTLRKPDGDLLPETSITPMADNKAKLTITEDMANELSEIGQYDILIHLYDERGARITIPEISFEVKKPLMTTNVLTNSGLVSSAILDDINEKLIRLNSDGKYNRTVWQKGDLITKEKLNKIEYELEDLNNSQIDVTSQLVEKANLTSIFSMANMGQDVKEAMTGGSVAVVGKNTVIEDNIVFGQITPPTTNFLKSRGNLIDNSYFKITQGKYLNGVTGEVATATGNNYWAVESFIPVIAGKTYVFNSAISWMYCYDSAKNFISRIATTDCSATWKRATVPTGTFYVRIYCDRSVFNYIKIYFFEYDSNLIYGTNEPTEDKLPLTNYYINNLLISDIAKAEIKKEVKEEVLASIPTGNSLTRISDLSRLILKGCKVKLIGDSITAGQGGTNFNSNFNTSGGELITNKIWAKSWYTNDTGICWANSLRDYLTQKFGCTVKNYGCPGIGIDQMLLAIDDLVRVEDELVICMIGTNNRHNMQLSEYYTKLKQLYDLITITKGKKCIMMSSMPASVENELSSNRIFHIEDIDNMHFKLSCEKNTEYISIFKEIIKYCKTKGINVDTLLTSDGLHPNDTGYDIMFMIICMALGFAPKRDGATW